MIDIKELQIGNKVKYKDSIVEIAATHLTGYVGILGEFQSMIVSVKCDEIEPIEVADKLLVKIGFETSGYPNEEGYAVYENETENYYVSICKSKNKCFCEIDCNELGNAGNFYFTYLHELQNGVRLITKKDLEVCL